jgi:hypothetical protein
MPVDQNNVAARNEAATAALSGLADINPADPIEAMLIAQMVVANEAALALYRRAWLNMPDYFEAGTQFIGARRSGARHRRDARRGNGEVSRGLGEGQGRRLRQDRASEEAVGVQKSLHWGGFIIAHCLNNVGLAVWHRSSAAHVIEFIVFKFAHVGFGIAHGNLAHGFSHFLGYPALLTTASTALEVALPIAWVRIVPKPGMPPVTRSNSVSTSVP